jgi:hypothetical protein
MPRLTRLPLLSLLHLRCPHLEYPHHTRRILALALNHHNLSWLQLLAAILLLVLVAQTRVWQAATGRCKAGRHERCAGQHEADCTAVDAQAVECEWVFVYKREVGEERVVHVLEEEGCVVEGVEGHAVGSVRVLATNV